MFNRIKRALFASAETPQVTAPTPAAPHLDPAAESASWQARGDSHLAQDRLEDAAACYRQAVAIHPGNGEAHCGLGMIFLQRELAGEAERHLRLAVAADPKLAQAYYFLGSALVKQGKLDQAVENLRKAIELRPDVEVSYRDLCFALFQSGRNDEAREVILQGLALNPGFADFHFFLGNLYSHDKDYDKAIAAYRQTLAIQPDNVGAYVNAGRALQDQGRLDEAIDCFRKALDLAPNLFEAYDQLGRIYKEQGKPDESIAAFRQALAIRPDSAEIQHNVGLVCKIYGRIEEAIAYYRRALELKPDFADTYVNLGNIFFDQGKLDEAVALHRKAIEIKPDFAIAWFDLAITLAAKRDFPEAAATLRRLLELDPDYASAKSLLFHQMQHMCDWQDWNAYAQAARHAALRTHTAKDEIAPLAFLSVPGATAEEQKRCAEGYTQLKYGAFAAYRERLGFDFKRPPNDRIRVGYLSEDFRVHAVSFLMAEIFELHDRSRFHVSAYSTGPNDNSPLRRRLEQAFDNFVDLRHEPYESAARKIYGDRIDILVDLSGYTQNSRTDIMALRPAPVQVNYLGYPGTMGADFIDYMIADRFTIPPEKQHCYTEKIVYMPDCFQANDRKRALPPAPTRAQCGLPEDAIVFCCFNQTFKITPDFFDVWCRLLRAVPGSVMWLAASTPQVEANLRREAAARGVEPERIIMAPLMQLEQHLARLQCADLFLDTLPFNAGTTCSDALWMGLPVVTCAGEAFASRMAGSLLTAIGAPELIAYDMDAYYDLALELATDGAKRLAIRDKIVANRDTAPVFDSARFTRNLEQAYVQMLRESARA